jgi:signal transduction histidine kinase
MKRREDFIKQLELFNIQIGNIASFEDLAQRAVRVGANSANADICTLWRVFIDETDSQQRLRLAAAFGVSAPQTLAQEITYAVTPGAKEFDGVTGYVASEQRVVLVNSYKQLREEYKFCHKGKMDRIQWKNEPNNLMRNLYAVPLTLGNELVGVLKVENHIGAGSFSIQSQSNINALANHIAIIAKALVLLDSHERRLIDAPARLSQALVQPFETEKLTQDIVNTIAETLNAEVCSLWLVDQTGNSLEHQADSGFRGKKGQVPSYTIGGLYKDDASIEGITAWVAIRRKPFWANSHEELRKHPAWRGKWDMDMFGGKKEAESRFRSMYAVPLVWKDELFGVLKVENPLEARNFSMTDRLKCDLMANYIVLLLAITRQLRLQLVPGMAHILNSPAAGIATMLGQMDRELKKESPDLDRLRKYVDEVKRSTLTITTMSRTLSAELVSRVGPQKFEKMEVIEFCREQVQRIKQLAPKGREIHFKSKVDKYFLLLSRSEGMWLEVILFNLLHNAIKFTNESGGLINVECFFYDEHLCISITDNGPGIPPDDLPHIFEPLFRKEAKGWHQGMGLGLYEVHRLLYQLGWSIKVNNIQPHGTQFYIDVPENWRQNDE